MTILVFQYIFITLGGFIFVSICADIVKDIRRIKRKRK